MIDVSEQTFSSPIMPCGSRSCWRATRSMPREIIGGAASRRDRDACGGRQIFRCRQGGERSEIISILLHDTLYRKVEISGASTT